LCHPLCGAAGGGLRAAGGGRGGIRGAGADDAGDARDRLVRGGWRLGPRRKKPVTFTFTFTLTSTTTPTITTGGRGRGRGRGRERERERLFPEEGLSFSPVRIGPPPPGLLWPPILATLGPGSRSTRHAHHAMHLIVCASG